MNTPTLCLKQHFCTPVIFLVLLLVLVACAGGESTTSEEEFPNIVLIIGDDHGYPYFGFMGADYVQTPNMDELAASGTLFTNGYVPDNHCRPSLATLMTGMLPVDYKNRVAEMAAEHGISDEAEKREFDHHAMQHFTTLATLLNAKGYASFQGGKWWEFNYRNGGFTHGMTTGWTAEDRKNGGQWFKQFMGGEGLNLGRATMEPVYEFIDQNKEQPMFIWYAPELPHYPFDAPGKYYNLYKDKEMTESAKRYYANCTWFDDGVGELRSYLKEVGEFENTLFIYVNDNGWEQRPDQEFWDDPMRSHNGGDKGKSSIFDQSFRTPIIFAWDGRIPSNTRLSQMIHSADIPATVLDYLQIATPRSFFGQTYKPALDGYQFAGRDQIIGNVTTTRSFNDMMGEPTEGYWLRNKDWFFQWNVTKGEKALFDMKADANNDHNLAAQNPEVVAKLSQRIENWKISKGIGE